MMNKRRITVKSKGTFSQRPDLVTLTFDLQSRDYHYKKTMDIATASIDELTSKIEELGFDRKDLKTASFDINTDYKSYRDINDDYQRKFVGYLVNQKLKLSFDYNVKLLGSLLKGISELSVKPELAINFSVKDQKAVEETILMDAAENARRKAEILAKASGAALGDLLIIDYDWSELYIESFHIESSMLAKSEALPEIEAEDVSASDTVRFVWELI